MKTNENMETLLNLVNTKDKIKVGMDVEDGGVMSPDELEVSRTKARNYLRKQDVDYIAVSRTNPDGTTTKFGVWKDDTPEDYVCNKAQWNNPCFECDYFKDNSCLAKQYSAAKK
ncbi:hypothetical protein HN777_04915 [Candidatus Woesearchaeota archaeon]|jgi:hypothetical protein|nr:hypothetical protein [Candidatus Woesearchaeota archaeon]MBT7403102.1 hypothetical protein [Candidatus Woesearchaeota archaeon]